MVPGRLTAECNKCQRDVENFVVKFERTRNCLGKPVSVFYCHPCMEKIAFLYQLNAYRFPNLSGSGSSSSS